MKDDLKVEEIESSLTLGGSGEVTKGEGKGEEVDSTLLSYTHRYIILTETVRICQVTQVRRYGCDNASVHRLP
jgi:hypothetical protein